MSETNKPFRTALVGCGGMGRGHAATAASMPDYEVIAICDATEAILNQTADRFPDAARFADYARMLEEMKPDVVIVATPTDSHARLSIEAAKCGARGIFCEKPMGISMAEGWEMVDSCRRHNTSLMVNHQRRTQPAFVTMRGLMETGAIGEIKLIRGTCFGDILSDGTHLIDTIRHLAGDSPVKWLLGQVCRDPANPLEARSGGFTPSGGWRYGHPIENGAFAIWEFESGIRAEIMTGSMHVKGRTYNDYEVFGTAGRLHRAGDSAEPALRIQDDQSGGWRAVPIDLPAGDGSVWQQVSRKNFEGLAQMIREGADHPLSGESALKDLEITMAVYESARLRARIEFPMDQPRFPLELMIESGEV